MFKLKPGLFDIEATNLIKRWSVDHSKPCLYFDLGYYSPQDLTQLPQIRAPTDLTSRHCRSMAHQLAPPVTAAQPYTPHPAFSACYAGHTLPSHGLPRRRRLSLALARRLATCWQRRRPAQLRAPSATAPHDQKSSNIRSVNLKLVQGEGPYLQGWSPYLCCELQVGNDNSLREMCQCCQR